MSGGSGMIGTALVRSWQGEPIHLLRLVRRNPLPFDASGAETLLWDPSSTQPLSDLDRLAGVDTVIHLSGANIASHRWTRKYKQEILSSRVGSTSALVNLLIRMNPLPRVFVCASAIGIYGDRGNELLTEDSPGGTGFIAETCISWENATRAAHDAGIRVVNARFGVALSPAGGALARTLPLFRLGLGGKLGNGREWMPWITLDDTIGALRYCIQNESLSGPVNLVAPNPATNAEFTHALAAAVHRPAVLPVPGFALRLGFGEIADEALLASARVVPQKLQQAGYRSLDPEIASALRRLLSTG